MTSRDSYAITEIPNSMISRPSFWLLGLRTAYNKPFTCCFIILWHSYEP